MKAILYVAIGGALGALLRYAVGLLLRPENVAAFPVHTFVINMIGSLCIGIVFSYMALNGPAQLLQLFLITGVIGGFTTFSAFTMETVYLFQQGETTRGFLYVLLSNTLGIGSAWLGYSVIKWIS